MSTIGDIGIGLFILIILWIFTLVLFVIAVKTQSNLGWFVIVVATIITIVLTVIPTEKPNTFDETQLVETDYSHIYRFALLTFLLLSIIVGFMFFFILHCIEPVRVKPIKSFYVN